MHILIHSFTSVWPFYDGTTLRTFHITPYLAARHTCDLLQERWPWEQGKQALGISGYSNGWLETQYHQVWNVWHQPGERLRYGLVRQSSELYQWLDKLLVPGNYDAIWAPNDSLPIYLYDRRRRGLPVLVGPTDSAHLHYWREIRLTRNMGRLAWLTAKWALYALYQVHVLNRMPHWTMVTKKDAADMRRLSPNCDIRVIPNGVDVDKFAPSSGQIRDPLALVFVGTLGRGANEVAMEWFLAHVWPHVIESVSQANLTIVGCNPSPHLQELGKRVANVRVTGYVADPRPYLWSSGLFILPMQSGGGIKNKLLEAWAAGCAVVSTCLGAEGVAQAKHGENLLAVDQPHAMASAIISLMRNPDQQRKLGDAGRRTVAQYYTWEAVAVQTESYLAQIADQYKVN